METETAALHKHAGMETAVHFSSNTDSEVEASRSSKEEEANSTDILIGTYVGRDSSDGNGRLLLGKVVSYDPTTKLATIFYENGQREVLEHQHVAHILMMDQTKLSSRKRKLDHLAAVGEVRKPNTRSKKNEPTLEPTDTVQASLPCPLSPGYHLADDVDGDQDVDSSTDSSDRARDPVLGSSPRVQILNLPPSSGDINVPEESIPYLFSVYSFLRSFSFPLFLSPFGLDDFVGSVNCTVQNSLLDAIHLSLMRALKRHLEVLSSEDSDLASKCLRCYDWSLLDPLTWPAILVGYLYMSGQVKQLDEKEFRLIIAGSEYYGLPAGLKLKVLQMLCDDVVDSAEFRTELEMRGDREEPDEYSVRSRDPPESGPRRVHPRYSKTSACKSLEALEYSVEPKMPISNSKISVQDGHIAGAAQDENSDECLLCGMDGMLICCDGCPSAYHSRCIGLNKTTLPEGSWFCPECTINKLGMTSSRIGRGSSGAEIFGIDVNGRMFMGTCNYMLVFGMSLNSESLIRYYNSEAVPKVLSVLLSAESSSIYADICKGISRYWEVPLLDMQPGNPGFLSHHFVDNAPCLGYPSCITLSKSSSRVFGDTNGVHYLTNAAEESPSGRVIVDQKDHYGKGGGIGFSLGVDKSYLPSNLAAGHDLCKNMTQEATNRPLCPVKDEQFAPETDTLTVEKTSSPSMCTSGKHLHSRCILTETSNFSQDRLIFSAAATHGSANEVACKEDAANLNFSTKKALVGLSNGNSVEFHVNDEKRRTASQKSSQFPNVFKPQAYINQYAHGEVAASAAANMAISASEDNKSSEAHLSLNHRKAVAANMALQMKAFSRATSIFFWTGLDKKLMEIPRERCGWCMACKAASTCKKGCLLNLAAANVVKGSARNFSGPRTVKQAESHLPVVAAQIAHMEETLQGLIAGPLSDMQYNKEWHELARDASSCKMLKILLLELERNIRGIVFCGDWTKLVDDGSFELPSSASGMLCRAGTSKKRGFGGRRPRKQCGASEFENDCSGDSGKDVLWWRGGRLLKCLLQKGVLPSSLVRKAGRQGGIKRISGVHYPESSELARKSRQFAWRASVEMTKNVSQLAFQIRYLDAHVRWKDLVRPEQSPVDGKGSEIDATVFRNATISDKRITENKIQYALTFSIQKHLSVRVTKNVLETEKLPNGNEKLWFLENHIPLYLIKEYEEKFGLKAIPSTAMLWSRDLLRSRKRQLKNRDGIFSYLMHKGERSSRFSCASCQQDMFLRDSVRCSTCQGHCHKDCAIASIAVKEDDLEFMFVCNLCYVKPAPTTSDNKETLKTHLSLKGENQQCSLQVQNQHQAAIKCMLQSGHKNPAQPVGKVEVSSAERSSASGSAHKVRRSGQSSSCGLIWKRKKGDDCGEDFRMNNILLKGKEDAHPGVVCSLCKKPFRSDLMYIRCGSCPRWFHADALQLEEHQIFDLAGFKCCPCRRKGSPRCPYADSDRKKVGVETHTGANVKRKGGVLSETPKSGYWNPPTSKLVVEEDIARVDEDPLLHSFGKVEPIGELSLGGIDPSGGPMLGVKNQQKLSVRRPLVKQENGAHQVYGTQNEKSSCTQFNESLPLMFLNGQQVELGADARETLAVGDPDLSAPEKLTSALVQWDSSKACGDRVEAHEDMDPIDQLNDPKIGISGDMEYEPQTYFSFNELLASDDQTDDQYDMAVDAHRGWPFTDFETKNQDLFHSESWKAYDLGPSNEFGCRLEHVLNVVPCHLCKLVEPSPDLTCEACNMRIHSHCSPWEDSEAKQWRCGNCRDWR